MVDILVHLIALQNYDQGAPTSHIPVRHTAQRFCQASAAFGQNILPTIDFIVAKCSSKDARLFRLTIS